MVFHRIVLLDWDFCCTGKGGQALMSLENAEFFRKNPLITLTGPQSFLHRGGPKHYDKWKESTSIRNEHISQFGFAVLTEEIIEAIRGIGNFLEVGCGTGYWSYELNRAGIDVIATDPYPPGENYEGKYQFARSWTSIEKIMAKDAIKKYPERNLLTVWHDYAADWTGEMLLKFQGQYIVYVGEGSGGCTGSDAMHEILDSQFDIVQELDIPQFLGLNDRLFIYKRKE